MSVTRPALLAACLGALTLVATTASGQVAQPAPFTVDGVTYETVPVDETQSSDYFDTERYNVSTLGLGEMLYQLERGDVDYQTDAATYPATFSPLCGLTGQLILRGGSCNMDFGWYCVDDPSTFVPLVTAREVQNYHDALTGNWERYKNDDKGFVPLIGMPPVTGGPLENVRNHPVFLACPSQQIGFTIKPTGIDIPSVGEPVCTQQKYSEPSLNPIHTASGKPWVSALTYASVHHPGVYYLAFEDLPSNGTTFNPPTDQEWQADGDFNDFVYRVEGIQCEGGGLPCRVDGAQGICEYGVTECTVDGSPGDCSPKFAASSEVCDNIDNDCNGFVDDGDDLCPPEAPRCFEGNCVARCSTGEFPCPLHYSCDLSLDLCVLSDCVGISCPAGQACRGGVCVGGCDGVVCPSGEDCLLGRCIDLCQGVECPSGFVCQRGACIADCHCLPCPPDFSCEADGRCVDTACKDVVCDPGLVCELGACVDACSTVHCPVGQICVEGRCKDDPNAGTGGIQGNGGALTLLATGGTNVGAQISHGATGATEPDGPTRPPVAPKQSSCTCSSPASGGAAGGAVAWLLLGMAVGARRRRRHPS